MSAASGMEFWLDYIDHHGGVYERTGDGALVVLPPELAARHGNGEEFMVTAEPEVAAEGAATLLTPGHPLLTVAAEAVLTAGDNGRVRLPRPAGRAPSAEGLLDQLRGCFPVDHGRIDLMGGPRPAVRQVVRVGTMVTFALSADDQFQEHLECWVDTEQRLALPSADVAGLVPLLADQHPERSDVIVDSDALRIAVCAADEEIRRRARDRQESLAQQVDESRANELGRAGDYYREMIGSLIRRRDAANEERSAAYQGRIDAAEAERDRRLAEIDAKYKGSLTILPFRLQVIGVPVLRLEVDVRRGDRRYPLVLDWLAPTRSFAAIRCPQCGSTAALVAGKSRLGCRSCLPKVDAPALRLITGSAGPKPSATTSATDPTAPAAPAAPAAPPPPRAPDARTPPVAPTARTPRPSPTGPRPVSTATSMYPKLKVTVDGRLPSSLSPARIASLESKLVRQLWELVDRRESAVRRMLAPDSPADALVSMYGVSGLRRVIGLPESASVNRVRWAPDSTPDSAGPRVTDGVVEGSDGPEHPFQMCWHIDNGRALIDELTPFAHAYWPILPDAIYLRFRSLGGLFALPPDHPQHIWSPHPTGTPQYAGISSPTGAQSRDEVTDILTTTTLTARGLPITLRCLAAWWRTPGRAELLRIHGPAVLVAALDRMICNRAGATQSQYAEFAHEHHVGVPEMKAASALLQKRLGLSATKPW